MRGERTQTFGKSTLGFPFTGPEKKLKIRKCVKGRELKSKTVVAADRGLVLGMAVEWKNPL